ncbi:two-component system chemotaxis sensor kinase CheA [Alteromonadaceae bacterium 2753L.S.0a.02]|nr:two-component system chemotaxis sensor kinase CheA [Alteromonadaceae bacterium 2753L.S.0a.02]
MNMDSALQTFFAEADELLDFMESALLRLEDGIKDDDTLNEIFRSAHTIKGSAGLFGLSSLVGFTHFVENVLDKARDGDIEIDQALQGLLLNCKDHMVSLLDDVRNDVNTSDEKLAHGEALISQLTPWLSIPEDTELSQNGAPDAGDINKIGNDERPDAESDAWHISLRLSPDVLQNGMDPLSFFRFLSDIGEIQNLNLIDDALPDSLHEFNPEDLYLGFELNLETDKERGDIEEAFCFVQEGSDIRILPPHSKISEYIELVRTLPESNQKIGEILVKSGVLSQQNLDRALDEQTVQAAQQKAPKMLGEILIEKDTLPTEVIDVALDKQKKFAERPPQESRFIRVDADKLDTLINLIGELVISRQRVDILANETHHAPLLDAVANLGGFTEHIRDAALTLRMVPIGDTFQRFRRLVRDTAANLDKSIELKIRGAETELDRSMVEKLNDPLTHIVRNAIDHGIESEATRIERNKPATGSLCLSAYHDAGIIVIEVSDDGGGLDLEKIRAKAIKNGVIEATSQLSEQDLKQLIFHPGLSTADQVTDLSGRGVGMDVVKRNIDALQGSIEIDTKLGVGTRICIRLPLTLAIIDGFHVVSSDTHFIIPQNTVLECMDLAALKHVDGRNCVNLRGDQIPYIRLSEIFSLQAKHNLLKHIREKLVVVQFGETRSGIVVEELLGEVQTVVKPLSPIFQSLQGIGGSSLLGSGDIAFILDIPQLIEYAIHHEDFNNREHHVKAVQER